MSVKINEMKVLLITRYYPPLNGIATERMASWVKYFRDMGHKTIVLTTEKESSNGDSGVVEIPYFDPITAFGGDRLKEKSGSKNSRLARFYRKRLNERMPGRTDPWVIPAVRYLKNLNDIDFIISSYGPPSAHIVGYFAKKLFGCLWFADFRDLWVDNHNYQGLFPFTLLEKWWEKKICEKADALMTVSEGLKAVLKAKYPQKDVLVIPNGFDQEAYLTATGGYFDDSTKFRMAYTGTIYEEKHSLDMLFDALGELGCISEKFELLFYGAPSRYLEDKIAEYRVEKIVRYSGQLPPDKIKDVQLSSNAFLQVHFNFDRYDGLVSGKVYEYLFAGKPILGVGIPRRSELGRLILRANGGVLCQTKEEIKKNLTALVEGDIVHKSDQDFIKTFSRKRQAEEIMAAASAFSQRMISSS